jgi:tight adherence protein B
MRGLAALLAGVTAWILVARPHLSFRIPQLSITPRALAAAGLLGLLTFLPVLGILQVPAAAASIALLVALIPLARARAVPHIEAAETAHEWPDVLALLRGRLASGDPLPDAFIAALQASDGHLSRFAPQVERDSFFGGGFASALNSLRIALKDPTADHILLTLGTAHRVGGQRVGAIVSALGISVGDDLRVRAAHHAALTEQRMTALVALVAPWGLLALTISTNPAAAAAYQTGSGARIIGIGLAITLVGYAIGRRVADLSRPPRLFQ